MFLGTASLLAQLALLQEFLCTFTGNELIIGFVLGYWFILTAFGAEMGRRWRKSATPALLFGLEIAAGLAPLLQVVAIRLLRATLLPGVAPGSDLALWAIAIILLPGCFVNGWLFAIFVRLITKDRGNENGQVYLPETVGLAIGGLLYSLFLCTRLGSFGLALLIAAQNGLAAVILAWASGWRRLALSTGLTVTILLFAASWCGLDVLTLQAVYAGGKVVAQTHSPYGHLVVTEAHGQRAYFQQGVPLFTTQDTAAREERVHFALAQREPMDSVLLIGGAACRAADEVLKYGPQRVDCVDPDPAVLAALKEAGETATRNAHVNLIETDARKYVRQTKTRYNAIVMGLPPPESVQLNRFFTREFFTEAAARLEPGGVITLDLPGSEGYLAPSQLALIASIHGAFQAIFRYTLIIPGEKMTFLGSNAPLTTDVPAILARRHISVRFMTEGYLATRLTPERLNAARTVATAPAPPNSDFAPASFGHALSLWLDKSGGHLEWSIAAFAALIILIGSLLSRGPLPRMTFAITTTGFAGFSLEMILIIVFQVLYGSLYLHLGALFAAFMIGTAVGAFLSLRGRLPTGPRGVGLLDAAFVILAPASALAVQQLATAGSLPLAGPLLIGLGLALAGFIVGAQFPLAAREQAGGRESSSSFYAADLAGSCLGAFATTALLLPVMGVTGICWLLAGIKFASLIGLWSAPPHASSTPIPGRGATPIAWITTGYFALTGVIIVSEKTHMSIYAATFYHPYIFTIITTLFLALWATWNKNTDTAWLNRAAHSSLFTEWIRIPGQKWLSLTRVAAYLLLGLVAFFPVFRCYFRIPYLFCHVCPRQCIFGYLRTYLVGGALLINLGQAPFCARVCPVGTLFDTIAPPTPPSRRLARTLWTVRLGVLVCVVLLYFLVEHSAHTRPSGAGPLYIYLFRNDYAVGIWSLITGVALICLGWRIKRAFCSTLCPIGATSDLVARLLRTIPPNEGDTAATKANGKTQAEPGGLSHD